MSMSATAISACPLDHFDDVFGSRRGAEGERQRALIPLFSDIASGRMQRPLNYLTDRYLEGTLEGDPVPALEALMDAYATGMARQAVERWQPSVAAYLEQFGISVTPEMVTVAQRSLWGWVDYLRYEPDIYLCDGDQGWNDAWADARMQEGSAEVLAPLFLAAPKTRMEQAIGPSAYGRIDQHCRQVHGETAAARSRRFDVIRWGKVFDMLSDYGSGEINPAQPARGKKDLMLALEQTFTALLEGEF